jgi:hypothetical protein
MAAISSTTGPDQIPKSCRIGLRIMMPPDILSPMSEQHEQPRKMMTIFITAVLVMVVMIAAWTLWTLVAPMLPS